MTDDRELTTDELRAFSRLAGYMVPASESDGLPGADDATIFADIVASLGRDRVAVGIALAALRAAAGEDFASLSETRAQQVATAFLSGGGPMITALGRAVLQCYYRDDRVVRSLGLEPRAPFPKGHAIEPGDWSLLEAVKGRPRMWRDVDGGRV